MDGNNVIFSFLMEIYSTHLSGLQDIYYILEKYLMYTLVALFCKVTNTENVTQSCKCNLQPLQQHLYLSVTHLSSLPLVSFMS